MQTLVTGEIARCAEALIAGFDRALVGLFPRVSLEMFMQRKLSMEATAAHGHGTRKWPILLRATQTWMTRHSIGTNGSASTHGVQG